MSTRLAAETAVADSLGPLLVFVGKTATPTGSNPAYNHPLGYGLWLCGHPPADPAAVTDSDISVIASGVWYKFIDLTEWRMLVSAAESDIEVSGSVLDNSQSWSDIATRAYARIDKIEERYKAILNPVYRPAVSGTVNWQPSTATIPRWGPGFGRPWWGPWGW